MSEALDKDAIKQAVVAALKTIYDPEIPVSIYELGLIYDIDVSDEAHVHVTMTLTTPHCPEAQTMPASVEREVNYLDGVSGVSVDITWEPTWGPELMSEAAKLALGF